MITGSAAKVMNLAGYGVAVGNASFEGSGFDLLLDEPLHELLGGVVLVLAGEPGERIDLLGDAALLRQGERVLGSILIGAARHDVK